MWFGKSKSDKSPAPYPGEARVLDGQAAVYAMESMVSDGIVVQVCPETIEGVRKPTDTKNKPILRTNDPSSVVATLVGYAASGLRAAGMVASAGGLQGSFGAVAGKRLPCVVHLAGRAAPRQAGAVCGGHDDYYALGSTGWFQMFARDAQEAADFTLIAHRVAETSLTPGLCAHDLFRTGHSVQPLRLPDQELAEAFVGRPSDVIDTPNAAQKILFGERRRRVPVLTDRDHPAGVGGVQDGDSYYRAVTAQRPFFAGHLGDAIDEAMERFYELTGRRYAKVHGHKTDDAEVVVVAQGALARSLEAAADYVRAREKLKAGVVTVSVFRPFPGAELSKLLEGKRVVTVVEQTDQPLAEDLPLTGQVRGAVGKASENGTVGEGNLPHRGYAAYGEGKRPAILSAVTGVGGGDPSLAELVAVFRNMTTGASRKSVYYLGAAFGAAGRSYPHLQALDQSLASSYPDLGTVSLAGVPGVHAPASTGKAIAIHSLSAQGGLFAGNLFAQALADAGVTNVATFPRGGLEQNLQPSVLTLWMGQGGEMPVYEPVEVDALLVTGERLLETALAGTSLRSKGLVVVGSNRKDPAVSRALSRSVLETIRSRDVTLTVVDAAAIAARTASKPSFSDQLEVWALLGAYAGRGESGVEDQDVLVDRLTQHLTEVLGKGRAPVEDVAGAFRAGASESVIVEMAGIEAGPSAEAEPPWTVRDAAQWDRTLFDVTRFWNSVGYFYDIGRPAQTIIDPFVATGVIPARSSAFRDLAPYRLRVPRWVPPNCTGCGDCFAACPDSALPATVQPISAVLTTAIEQCREAGAGMIQMQRIVDHLGKQAHKLIAAGGPDPVTRVGDVLAPAFDMLVQKMDMPEDKLNSLREEFDLVATRVSHLAVARTERFFDERNKAEKGSGELLAIAVNPKSCTGCGLCIEVCPDDALEWTEQTPELLEAYRSSWEFLFDLPVNDPKELEKRIAASDPKTEVYRLFNRDAYHTLVGGDGAHPGTGAKTAVHLAVAVAESVVRPRFETHVERLSGLIDRLEEKIQGTVSETLEINDFEEFGKRLSALGEEGINAERLSSVVGDPNRVRVVDHERLERLTGLLSRLKAVRELYRVGADGNGRSRLAMAIDPGDDFWSGVYPFNPHAYPWIAHLPGDAPALAEGIYAGILSRLAEEFKTTRMAELELEDEYLPRKHDEFFERFGAVDFSEEEWSVVPPVFVLADTSATSWNRVERVLRGNLPIKLMVINTAPLDAGADLGLQALSQHGAFIVQTSIGNPWHLIRGVADALSQRRPALIHVHAPSPQASGVSPEKIVEHAVLACRSRAFPLFVQEPGGAVDLTGNPEPEDDWPPCDLDVTEPSGEASKTQIVFTTADWAARGSRFDEHFRVLPKGELGDQMTPLSDYLDLSKEGREGILPYIRVTDAEGRLFIATVSPEMVEAVVRKRERWRSLCGRTVGVETPAETVMTKPKAEEAASLPPSAVAGDRASFERLTERLLWLSGYGRDPEFFKRSLSEFVTQRRETDAPDE